MVHSMMNQSSAWHSIQARCRVMWDQLYYGMRVKSRKVNESHTENGSSHQWQAAILMVPPCEGMVHQWCNCRSTDHYTWAHLSAHGRNGNKGLPHSMDEHGWYFNFGSYFKNRQSWKGLVGDITADHRFQIKSHWQEEWAAFGPILQTLTFLW